MTRLRDLAAAVLLLGMAGLSIQLFRAETHPERPPSTRFGWIAGPSSDSLGDAARRQIKSGLKILNDVDLPAAERIDGYHEALARAEVLLVRSLRAQAAQPMALAELTVVRWDRDPPRTSEARKRTLDMIALASRLAPTFPGVQEQLGMLSLRMGRTAEALHYLATTLELDPSRSREVIALLQDHMLPAAEMLAALPRHPRVLVHLEGPFLEESRTVEYRSLLEQELTRDVDALYLVRYGGICLRLGEASRLIQRLTDLGTLASPAVEAERLTQLARGHLAASEPGPAVDAARRAAALQPEAFHRAENLGQIALAAADLAAALDGYESGLGILARSAGSAEDRARLYAAIGNIQQRAGRPDRAYDAFRKAAELDPAQADARERVERMEQAAGF